MTSPNPTLLHALVEGRTRPDTAENTIPENPGTGLENEPNDNQANITGVNHNTNVNISSDTDWGIDTDLQMLSGNLSTGNDYSGNLDSWPNSDPAGTPQDPSNRAPGQRPSVADDSASSSVPDYPLDPILAAQQDVIPGTPQELLPLEDQQPLQWGPSAQPVFTYESGPNTQTPVNQSPQQHLLLEGQQPHQWGPPVQPKFTYEPGPNTQAPVNQSPQQHLLLGNQQPHQWGPPVQPKFTYEPGPNTQAPVNQLPQQQTLGPPLGLTVPATPGSQCMLPGPAFNSGFLESGHYYGTNFCTIPMTQGVSGGGFSYAEQGFAHNQGGFQNTGTGYGPGTSTQFSKMENTDNIDPRILNTMHGGPAHLSGEAGPLQGFRHPSGPYGAPNNLVGVPMMGHAEMYNGNQSLQQLHTVSQHMPMQHLDPALDTPLFPELGGFHGNPALGVCPFQGNPNVPASMMVPTPHVPPVNNSSGMTPGNWNQLGGPVDNGNAMGNANDEPANKPTKPRIQKKRRLAAAITEEARNKLPARSRGGCWTCRKRKVKCDEERPKCGPCTRLQKDCDYAVRLTYKDETSKMHRKNKKEANLEGCWVWDATAEVPKAFTGSQQLGTPISGTPTQPFYALDTQLEREERAILAATNFVFQTPATYGQKHAPTPAERDGPERFLAKVPCNEAQMIPPDVPRIPGDPNTVRKRVSQGRATPEPSSVQADNNITPPLGKHQLNSPRFIKKSPSVKQGHHGMPNENQMTRSPPDLVLGTSEGVLPLEKHQLSSPPVIKKSPSAEKEHHDMPNKDQMMMFPPKLVYHTSKVMAILQEDGLMLYPDGKAQPAVSEAILGTASEASACPANLITSSLAGHDMLSAEVESSESEGSDSGSPEVLGMDEASD